MSLAVRRRPALNYLDCGAINHRRLRLPESELRFGVDLMHQRFRFPFDVQKKQRADNALIS